MSTTIQQLPTYDAIRSATSTRTGSSDLDPQAFLKLLMAQMKYQDPLQGTDTQQFMQQVSTLSSMQQQYSLNEQMANLMSQQSLQGAAALVGKTIKATVNDQAIEGQVTKVGLKDGVATLYVGENQVPYSAVTQIS